MIGLAYASVPLYRIFCQVTGFGGTPQTAEVSNAVTDVPIKVRFDANVDKKLPWQFEPVQREVTVNIGEESLVFYRAKNVGDKPVTGTATFNVTPLKAGEYFVKIDCFCFEEQILQPGEEVDMPVTFFVDPSILDDKNVQDVKTITLSYSFFEQEP